MPISPMGMLMFGEARWASRRKNRCSLCGLAVHSTRAPIPGGIVGKWLVVQVAPRAKKKKRAEYQIHVAQRSQVVQDYSNGELAYSDAESMFTTTSWIANVY